MPRKIRLHHDGPAKNRAAPGNLQKTASTAKDDDIDTAEAERQFQLELLWCIHRLEGSLADKGLNDKQKTDYWKVLQVLKNNTQPIVRKRQLMRTHFGDYRKKMKEEERKIAAKAKQQIKFVTPKESVSPNVRSTFLRKSLFQSTGDDSFKFNFQLDLNLDEQPQQSQIHNQTPNHNQTNPQVPKDEASTSSEAQSFKFNFSNSPFAFNFKVDD